jgi:hypothetical protein
MPANTRNGSLAEAYTSQRRAAGTRGIEWDFTFESWLAVWRESGRLECRGRGRDQYVMARIGDAGPYSASNVYITTNRENVRDYFAAHADAHRQRVRAGQTKKPHGGRGWTFVLGQRRPYQVMCRRRYIGCYATEQEAVAAYQRACSETP